MKDYWKKLLCALAIIPCTTLAVACSEPENPPTESGDGDTTGGETTGGETSGGETLSPEEQLAQEKAAAYTTLHTHAKTLKNSETTNFQMLSLMENISQNTLNEEKFKSLNAEKNPSWDEDFMDSLLVDLRPLYSTVYHVKTKGVYGYNRATSEGYSQNYRFVGDNDTGEYLQTAGLYTKKVGDKLHQYTFQDLGDSDVKQIHYVGDDYADYKYFSQLEQLYISDFVKYSTFDELVTKVSKEIMAELISEYGLELDESKFNLNTDIVKEGNDWKLVCEIATKEPFMIPGEFIDDKYAGTLVGVSLELNMYITFNSTGIKGASMEISTVKATETESSITILPVDMNNTVKYSIVLDPTIDNNVLTNTDFTGYAGTGNEGTIEKVKGDICFNILHDDNIVGKKYLGERDFGTNITVNDPSVVVTSISDIQGANNANYTEWYLDKECTIPAGEITTCPSYDKNLYAKVTPKSTAVQLNTCSTNGEDNENNSKVIFVIPNGTTIDLTTYYAEDYFGNDYELEGIYVNGSSTPLNSEILTIEIGKVYDIEFRFKLKVSV